MKFINQFFSGLRKCRKGIDKVYKITSLLRKRGWFILTIVTLAFGSGVVNAQVTWDYPVKPGSEEWRLMPYAEKVEKSQPPKELLNSWDTETLFKYCVDYPLNKVIGMYNNPNEGFKRVYEQSTVWQEFIQRKNALNVFAQYFEMRPFKQLFEIKDDKNLGNELVSLYFLEKLVSETDFSLHLDSSDRRKLANIIYQTHQSKREYPDRIFGFPYNSSLVALVKILESDQVISSNDEISLANFRGKTGNESFVDETMESSIVSKAINYINK